MNGLDGKGREGNYYYTRREVTGKGRKGKTRETRSGGGYRLKSIRIHPAIKS